MIYLRDCINGAGERERERERAWRRRSLAEGFAITAGFIANFVQREHSEPVLVKVTFHIFSPTDDPQRQWRFSLCTGGDAEARQAAWNLDGHGEERDSFTYFKRWNRRPYSLYGHMWQWNLPQQEVDNVPAESILLQVQAGVMFRGETAVLQMSQQTGYQN